MRRLVSAPSTAFPCAAIKFTNPGGTIVVRVHCEPIDDGDGDDIDEEETDSPVARAAAALTASAPSLPDGPADFQSHPPPLPSPLGLPGAELSPLAEESLESRPIAGASPDPTAAPAAAAAAPVGSSAPAGASPRLAAWSEPRRVLIRVSVTDSGRGLSADELPLLFRPYVQFQSGEQQQGKGTGLGLNISKSLVELHGGTIGVESSGVPGEGCCFWMESTSRVGTMEGAVVSS